MQIEDIKARECYKYSLNYDKSLSAFFEILK